MPFRECPVGSIAELGGETRAERHRGRSLQIPLPISNVKVLQGAEAEPCESEMSAILGISCCVTASAVVPARAVSVAGGAFWRRPQGAQADLRMTNTEVLPARVR